MSLETGFETDIELEEATLEHLNQSDIDKARLELLTHTFILWEVWIATRQE